MKIETIGKNHIVVSSTDVTLLFSHGIPVAGFYSGNFVTPDWEYSKTTIRYVAEFLGLSVAELHRRISYEDIRVIKNVEIAMQFKIED